MKVEIPNPATGRITLISQSPVEHFTLGVLSERVRDCTLADVSNGLEFSCHILNLVDAAAGKKLTPS